MAIGCAMERGSLIYGPDDSLMGFTGSTVTLRLGSVSNLFDQPAYRSWVWHSCWAAS